MTLYESKNVHDFKSCLEGLIDDFDYVYWHAILSYCGIIGDWNDDMFWKVWLIRENEETMGFCGLYSLKKHNNEELWLGWFGILPEHRNKGLGSKVLSEMENVAKSVGCKVLHSYVDEEGKPLSFYYRNGFERICSVGEYVAANIWCDPREFENDGDHVIRKVLC